MKKHHLIILIMLLFSCSFQQPKTPIENKSVSTETTCKTINLNNTINSLIFYCMDINTDTPFRINCNDFQSYFSDMTRWIEKDSIFINSFENKLSNLKKNNYPQNIDTRYQIVIKYDNGKQELICGDRFNIYFRNEYYNVDNSFLSLFYEKEDL